MQIQVLENQGEYILALDLSLEILFLTQNKVVEKLNFLNLLIFQLFFFLNTQYR